MRSSKPSRRSDKKGRNRKRMDEETLEKIEKTIFRAATEIADENDWTVTVIVAQLEEDGTLRFRGRQIGGESLPGMAVMEAAEEELKNMIAQEREAGRELTWPQLLIRSGDEEIDLAITMAIERALEAFEGELEEQEVATGAARVIIGGKTLSEEREEKRAKELRRS